MLGKIPSLGEIARSPYQSADPGMWPAHAWLPACGATANVVHDVCGGAHANMSGSWNWAPHGLQGVQTLNTGTYNYGAIHAGALADMNQDFTVDFVWYLNGNDFLPHGTLMSTGLFESDENRNSIKFTITAYRYYTAIYQYRHGGASSSVDYYAPDVPGGSGDNRYLKWCNISLIRIVCKNGSPTVVWWNGERVESSTSVTAVFDWDLVNSLFSATVTSYVTYGTVLQIALHNRVIDEPLTDPFSWARSFEPQLYLSASQDLIPVDQGGDWEEGWLNGYSKRREITLANATATLSNFPMAIPLASTDIDAGTETGVDVRFTASDGETELKHEWTGWTDDGNSGAFVKIPSITTSGATIYLYYGKTDATDGSDKANVWTDAIVAAHLDNYTSGDNESANDYELTNTGTVGTATGVLGEAVDMTGTNAVNIGTTGDIFDKLTSSTGYSLSVYIKGWDNTTSANYKTIFLQGVYGQQVFLNFTLWQSGTAELDAYLDNVSGTRYRTLKASGLSNGADAHICAVLTLNNPGTQATGTIYINGSSVGSTTFSTSETTFSVGTPSVGPKLGAANYAVDGALDEFRFHSKALSADEVAYLYGNLTNTGNNFTLGEEEELTSLNLSAVASYYQRMTQV